MYLFEAVKESVTARAAAEYYGIKVNRNGMACCPFHHDRTPSMKLDKRYHCFGCQKDGNVIDFTAKLFGLTAKEAAEKLAQDFSVSYESWHKPGKHPIIPRASPLPPKKSYEQEYQEAEDRVYRAYSDYYHLLRQWKEEYAPKSPDEEFDDRFVEACQKLSIVEYLLDTMLTGSIEERAAIVKEKAKEVINLERRISESTAGRTGICPCGNQRNAEPDEISDHKAKSANRFDDRAL